MPRASRLPYLPPDLVDGLLDGLRRVSAIADLLQAAGTTSEAECLRDRTLSEAAGLILTETARMLALVRSYEPKPPAP